MLYIEIIKVIDLYVLLNAQCTQFHGKWAEKDRNFTVTLMIEPVFMRATREGAKIMVVLVALILFFGRYLMEMFTSTPEVIDTGMHMMRILAIGYVAMAVTQILSGVMRGAGDTMTPMWISLITTVVIRVPIAYGLAALMHSADALFISLLTSWVMGAVLTSIAFRMGRWKKKSIINDDVPEPADVQV